MLKKATFDQLLAKRQTLIIDGALATELEVRGHDLNHSLWSALILRDKPESIENVHLDYYLAGADIAITASYQAATKGLTHHFGLTEDEGKGLIRRSVHLAQAARTAAYKSGIDPDRQLLVAGSVGPYGAYLSDGSEYRGDYVRTSEEFKDFHRPRLHALVEAGVDLLALETIPNMDEIKALLDLLRTEFPGAIAWLSCTTRTLDSLSDGTKWEDVLTWVNDHSDQIVALGINCVPFDSAVHTLQHLGELTQMPLVCYPNSGETWNSEKKQWHGTRPDDVLDLIKPEVSSVVASWVDSGAKLVGGCCRTGPTFVRAIAEDLERYYRV